MTDQTAHPRHSNPKNISLHPETSQIQASQATTQCHPQSATATEPQLQLKMAADNVVYSKLPQQQ
jgi:hypothetical protein